MRTRIVADTNVLISGVLFGGPPRRVLELSQQGVIQLCLSRPLLDEFTDVLARPKFRLDDALLLLLADTLVAYSLIVVPQRRVRVIRADPDDNRVLECAHAAGAQYIVSGDHHLLTLRRYSGIPILSPATFLMAMER
ncbi:MAG: putative toxin-antitoxin system toxin component, PIN family [Deltaproteobacteria bacterium]|nr:putative toxin-antitoxin system toxin component, PIN family [Deltaproteobacteria bacterium]